MGVKSPPVPGGGCLTTDLNHTLEIVNIEIFSIFFSPCTMSPKYFMCGSNRRFMCGSNRRFTNPPTGQGRDITCHVYPSPGLSLDVVHATSGYHSGATPRWGYHFFIGPTGIALCLCTTTGNITIFTFPTQGISLVTLAPTLGVSPKVYVRPTEYHCNFPK